ncbi:hypothetical protein FRC08_004733 [Ceratobasidium sp. 394]|nr:hypothetical protein FRC08_004733 [Ceratobasidium sp. 394]
MSKLDYIDVDVFNSSLRIKKLQRTSLLSIPSEALELLPPPSLSVSAFLSGSDYAPTARQSAVPQEVVFSHDVCDPSPHAIVKALKGRSTFPPLSTIRSLEARLDEAWCNGYRSIQDTYYEKFPLPFWVLALWSRLQVADNLRAEWMAAEERIHNNKHRDPDIQLQICVAEDRLQKLLHQVAWHEPILGFPALGWRPESDPPTPKDPAAECSGQTKTSAFVQFFCDGLLNDEAMNMMLNYLDFQVRRHESLAGRVVVADLTFTNRLLTEYSGKASITVTRGLLLQRYGSLFTELGREVLYFVVNSGGDHWAAFKVDFMEETIAYGDSLSGYRPLHKAGFSALSAWLKHLLGPSTNFTQAPNLPCETQQDGFSCGIAACTTISSSLGFEDGWSCDTARYMRLTWAQRVVKTHIQAKKSSATDPNSINDPVLASNVSERSAESRRLALGSILNDTESAAMPPTDTDILSNTLRKSLTMDWDTVSNSSSVEILSDPGDQQATSSGNPTFMHPDAPKFLEHYDVLSVSDSDCDAGTSEADFWEETSSVNSLPPPVPHADDNDVLELSDSDEDTGVQSAFHVLSPTRAPGKHQRSSSDDAGEPHAPTPNKRPALSNPYEERHSGPTGISRAAMADRAANKAYMEGTLIVSAQERAAFLRRARNIHESARLDPKDPGCKTIWHGPCERWITMDGPKRTKRYREHDEKCEGKDTPRKNGKFTKAAAGSLKIDTLFRRASSSALSAQIVTPCSMSAYSSPAPSPTPPLFIPCCGLRPDHDVRITNMLGRDPLGGRKSITTLAKERYNSAFKDLSDTQKVAVRMAATATASWQVHYNPQPHIRSTKCLQQCDPSATEIETGPNDICQKCADLLAMREFQNALNRPVPPKENLKFVPKHHRNKDQAVLYGRYVGLETIIEQADSKRSPMMNLVAKVLTGALKNADTFIGLMEIMAAKEDRVSRGKGMQGLARSPALISFCHATLISSPRAYRLLGKHLPLPAERSLQRQRSRQPSFPIGVTDENVIRAVEYLNKLNYTGPVGLSCDDTQLLSKFSPYYDGQKNKWYLLGGVGEPIEIDDEVDGVEKRVADATENSELATKCRLWCLQVPTPGVPVFILAALPISSTLKAEDLLATHNRLIHGLLNAGVCVVSHGTDGSKTERKVSSLFLESAGNTETKLIPHPRPGFPDISITLYCFGPNSTPVVTIQDVKHAMKTARNCIYSGTRSMVLGNCVVHYLQVLMLSVHPRSPLYQRDVSKVDRQDDRAATRLFSSAFLQHIVQIASEQHSGTPFKPAPLSIVSADLPPPTVVLKHSLNGLLVFLFVLGDAFDAFQSRSLDIPERVHMIMRLFFFLEIWKSSLKTLGYSEAEHFVTRDLYDILCNLVHSFMSLVFIYRDKLDHPNYPFCGWLHSTEGVEHTFAEARKAKADFDFADFISMVPKLDVMSMVAASTDDKDLDMKARASGYSHTLYSKLGINIGALSNFPHATPLHQAIKTAYEEAEAVFSRCGIAVTDALCPPPSAATNTSSAGQCTTADADYTAPAISTWFDEGASDLDDSMWVHPEMACTFAEEPRRLGTELNRLLEGEDHRWGTTAEMDQQIAAYGAATMALDIEERSQIDAMPYRDDEENIKKVRQLMVQVFPPLGLRALVQANQVNYESFVGKQTDPSNTFAHLVTLRSNHETAFAKKSIRIGHSLKSEVETPTTPDSDNVDDKITITPNVARSILLKKVHSTLKIIQDAGGSTSGVARRVRHEGQVDTAQAGNSANAAEAAKARGNEALKVRVRAFSTAKLKFGNMLGTGGVTSLAPIQAGSFAFVLVDKQIWFAEVLTLYSKGGGKAGKHGWVNNQKNLGSVSNLLVQLWEHWMDHDFRSVPKGTATHYAKRYAHIRSQSVLYVASSNEKLELHTDELVRLNSSLFTLWKGLNKELGTIVAVVDDMLRRRRKLVDDDD